MKKYLLAPSIIASDFTHLGDEIAACESAGANWLHVDVMDGHFVPTISVGPLFVEACKRVTKLPLDVHLMIEEPEKHVREFAQAGANNITIHVEACADPGKTIEQIQSYGCTAGVTLKPSTPVSAIESALPSVDLVLVMSVTPGFSGQVFVPETIEKVKTVRAQLDQLGSQAHLEVDGGISVNTLPLMKNAGANVFVCGTAVFKHPEGAVQGIKMLFKSLI